MRGVNSALTKLYTVKIIPKEWYEKISDLCRNNEKRKDSRLTLICAINFHKVTVRIPENLCISSWVSLRKFFDIRMKISGQK